MARKKQSPGKKAGMGKGTDLAPGKGVKLPRPLPPNKGKPVR